MEIYNKLPVTPVTLEDTVEDMVSDDYADRFRAEFWQLKVRTSALRRMIEDWDNGTLKFVPNCPRSTYMLQLEYMEHYLGILEIRAKYEGIVGC